MTDVPLYGFSLPDLDGRPRSLGEFRGRVLLLVNVASHCGNTPQYAGLQTLWERYRDRGLSVLGFPANNFGAQEPGTAAEIRQFCTEHYHVSFEMFGKISVKGADIHPLYRYLTTAAGVDGDIGWNFGKFVVDRRGRVAARYSPRTAPLDPGLTAEIESLLAAN